MDGEDRTQKGKQPECCWNSAKGSSTPDIWTCQKGLMRKEGEELGLVVWISGEGIYASLQYTKAREGRVRCFGCGTSRAKWMKAEMSRS